MLLHLRLAQMAIAKDAVHMLAQPFLHSPADEASDRAASTAIRTTYERARKNGKEGLIDVAPCGEERPSAILCWLATNCARLTARVRTQAEVQRMNAAQSCMPRQ